MDNKFTIGERIKSLREAKGLRAIQLARLAGCTKSYISEIENNKKKPSPGKLFMLAKALDTTPIFLLSGEDAQRLAIKKLIKLVEQHGDQDDLSTLRIMMDELRFALTFVQEQRLRVKESVLKVYEAHAKKGKVPEATKTALEDIQRDIDNAGLYMRAISQKIGG